MRNLENEAQNKKAEQWAKLDEKARRETLKATLGTPNGRAYIYDILQACGVFRNQFSSDALQMAYNTGQASIGLWIMEDMQAIAPQALQRMISERNQRNVDRTNLIDTLAGNGSGGTSESGGVGPVEGDPWGENPNLVRYPADE